MHLINNKAALLWLSMSKFFSPAFALILVAALLHVIEGVLQSAVRILKFTALAALLLVAVSEHACGIPTERLLRFGGRRWARAVCAALRQTNIEFQKVFKLVLSMQDEKEQDSQDQL